MGPHEFVVHDHTVLLPEDVANDVVFGMRDIFGFAPWGEEVKIKTEYSVPEGYEMPEEAYALTKEERDAFLIEVAKNTAQIEAGEATEVEPTDSPLGRNKPLIIQS